MSNMKTVLSVLVAMLMLSGIAMAGTPRISVGVPLTLQFAGLAAPIITVNGDNPTTVERYAVYTDAGATALDGNGNVVVITSGNVDNLTPGIYTITYTATNEIGTTTATREVTVVDTIAPAEVTGLAPGVTTTNSIEIHWSNTEANKSLDFTNVLVSVVKSSDPSVVILDKQPVGKVESYVINGLEPGTSYDILVQTADDGL